MSISAQVEGNYFNGNSNLSPLFCDILASTNQSTISELLQELLLIAPDSTISALSQSDNTPTLVIAKGINLVSGQAVLFQPADTITNSSGSPYRSVTGMQGVTGLHGLTGLRGIQGDTGVKGITGIVGLTGVSVIGLTGILGTTGVFGITGFNGLVGATGFSPTGLAGNRISNTIVGNTGAMGLTGSLGITGATVSGVTGLQGEPGLLGPTGAIGITGAVVAGLSLQGETGINIGSTGIVGNFGQTGLEGAKSFESLATTIQNTGTSASYILPANTLDTNNQQLDILLWGKTAANGASTTLLLQFGGTTLLSTPISGVFGATFVIKATILRLTGTSQENIVNIVSSSNTFFCQRTSSSISLASSQTLQISLDAPDGFVEALVVRKVWQ